MSKITAPLLTSLTANLLTDLIQYPLNTPSSFTPNNLSGLYLWNDPTLPSSLTIGAGGSVSEWTDKVNAFKVSQGTGSNQPLSGVSSINGLNVIKFSGSQTGGLNGGTNHFTITSSSFTIFVLTAFTNNGNNESFLYAGGPTNLELNPGRKKSTNAFSESAESSTASGLFTEFSQVSGSFIGTPLIIGMNKNNATQYHFRNGVVGVTASCNSFTATNFQIGVAASSFDKLTTFVGDIIIYNRSLSTIEMNQVGNYLGTRWNVVWNTIT